MATHSSVLARRIPGTGESGGLRSMGSHRIWHDWSDLAAPAAYPTSKEGSSKSLSNGWTPLTHPLSFAISLTHLVFFWSLLNLHGWLNTKTYGSFLDGLNSAASPLNLYRVYLTSFWCFKPTILPLHLLLCKYPSILVDWQIRSYSENSLNLLLPHL